MSIDRIGKPGAPAPGDVAGAGSSTGTGRSFEVGVAGAERAAAPSGSEALGRLQRGDIGLDQYLDARVDDAVAHLQGTLPADELAFVKQTLREQLSTDPV